MQNITSEYLRCEYRVNPLGLDILQPRLSWIVYSDGRNQRQTAYQILVADSRDELDRDFGNLWDSGRVETNQANCLYKGKPLRSRQRCHWKVRLWNGDGTKSEWSPPAFWTMGLLREIDWQAQWIGHDAPYESVQSSGHVATGYVSTSSPGIVGLMVNAFRSYAPKFLRRLVHLILRRKLVRFKPVLIPCPYIRKQFTARKPVGATLYASALGIYELHLNGSRVGDDYFAPGWTDYNRRVYYQTYDVTSLVVEGENVIGGILSDGWYSGYIGPEGKRSYYGVHPRLVAQLEIEYADGSVSSVRSDSTWKATTGPHLEADLLMGETYDARIELTGWTQPSYVDSGWLPVTVSKAVNAELKATIHAPVQKMGEIRPLRVWESRPGCYVFDFGRNFSGWVRLKVNGKVGTKVVLRFAERLNLDGTIYTANLRLARATDTYILKGDGEEQWEPRFTYHGFQYVEVSGYPGVPDLDWITGIVVHSALPDTGRFECSSDLVNALYQNIKRTQKANFVDIPTDCPQRDERLGWLGDAQVFARTATYNMDAAAFLSKWLVDVSDAISQDGAYPEFAPRPFRTSPGAPGWGDAGIICPWILYHVYGDTRVIEQHYGSMKKWIEYVREANPDLLWTQHTGNNNGDWLALDERTPKEVLATAYFAYSSCLLARMASFIGQEEDAKKYESLYQAIKQAFNQAYVAHDGHVKGDTQTCYVLALHFNLLPEELRSRSARLLVDAIHRAHGHLSTGFFGTAYLPRALTANGYIDTAYRLLLTETLPSWGYCIRQGATSVWERWDGWTDEKGFQRPTMNSFSHCSFGSIGEWLYTTVAGIDTDGPGFKRILIYPQPGGGLTYARAHYDSVNGRIATHWRIEGETFELDVTIPANTTATVFVPTCDVASVTEGKRPVEHAGEIELLRAENSRVVLKIGSGRYQFRANWAN